MRNSFALCFSSRWTSLALMRLSTLSTSRSNTQQLRFAERMEDDCFIKPIEKLRFKDALGFIENFLPHRVVIVSFHRGAETHHGLFLEQIRADVRSHDDDRIAE